jgi:hypothetical protein
MSQPRLDECASCSTGLGSDHPLPKTNQFFFNGDSIMATIIAVPMFAAAGYSAMYLLGGGGIFGAIVIFFVAKMMGK